MGDDPRNTWLKYEETISYDGTPNPVGTHQNTVPAHPDEHFNLMNGYRNILPDWLRSEKNFMA